MEELDFGSAEIVLELIVDVILVSNLDLDTLVKLVEKLENNSLNLTAETRRTQEMPTIKIPNLPPVKVLATGQAISATAEKAQISSITVETGRPGNKSHKQTEIYNEGKFVEGIHPSQASVIMNLLIGGLGGGRGDRPTAFASWCVEVNDKFNDTAFFSNLRKYTIVTSYNSRGGTMVYPFEDLMAICQIRARNTEVSQVRFPPDRKAPVDKTPKERKTVDVVLTL